MMLSPEYATIEMRRAYVPRCVLPHNPQPMISVCTVTVEDLSRRTEMGEAEYDVIEEHTSWIWFFDHEGFRHASRLARNILWHGLALRGMKSGSPTQVIGVDDEPCSPLIVMASPYHVSPNTPWASDGVWLTRGAQGRYRAPDRNVDRAYRKVVADDAALAAARRMFENGNIFCDSDGAMRFKLPSRGIKEVSLQASDLKGSVCVPRPWEALNDRAQARSYLEAASEEELREMAKHLLAGRLGSREQALLRRLILPAANANEKLWSRVWRAMAGEPLLQQSMRFRAPDQGVNA